MANNLTPEQLAAMQAYYAPSNSGWSPAMQSPYQADGQVYQQDGGFIYNYDPNKQEAFKDKFNVYNQDGTFSNEGTFKTDDAMQTFLMALAAAGGMQFLSGGLFAGAAGAGGGAGYGALGATEPIASIGATGGMTASELAALGAGGGGLGTMAPLATLEGPMSSSLIADSLTTMGGGGAAGLLGGAAQYLGPAATLLGAAAGSQGQKTSTTSERKTDPRVDPYLFGNNGQPGLLGMTYDQLSRDQSPERLAQRDQMRGVGMGLLSAPMAGNGFNKFFRG
jgi:hypothetical protein